MVLIFSAIGPLRVGEAPKNESYACCPDEGRSRLRGEDAVLDSEKRGGTPGRDADLRVDVLHVVICGLRRNHESVGDLPGREPEGKQPEHSGLAGGQSGRERRPGGATVTCRSQDPLDRLSVEAAGDAHGP